MNDEIKKNTLLFEGIDLFEKKKYAEAYEFFSKKVLDNPRDIEANMYLGLIGLDHLNKKDAWINIKVFFDSNMSNPENWKLFIRSLIFGDKISDAKNIMSIAEEKGLDKNFLSLMEIQLKDAEFNIIKEMTSEEIFFTDNETLNKNKAIDEVVISLPFKVNATALIIDVPASMPIIISLAIDFFCYIICTFRFWPLSITHSFHLFYNFIHFFFR